MQTGAPVWSIWSQFAGVTENTSEWDDAGATAKRHPWWWKRLRRCRDSAFDWNNEDVNARTASKVWLKQRLLSEFESPRSSEASSLQRAPSPSTSVSNSRTRPSTHKHSLKLIINNKRILQLNLRTAKPVHGKRNHTAAVNATRTRNQRQSIQEHLWSYTVRAHQYDHSRDPQDQAVASLAQGKQFP